MCDSTSTRNDHFNSPDDSQRCTGRARRYCCLEIDRPPFDFCEHSALDGVERMLWREWALTSPGLGDDNLQATREFYTLKSSKLTRLDGTSASYVLSTIKIDDMASRGRGAAATVGACYVPTRCALCRSL